MASDPPSLAHQFAQFQAVAERDDRDACTCGSPPIDGSAICPVPGHTPFLTHCSSCQQRLRRVRASDALAGVLLLCDNPRCPRHIPAHAPARPDPAPLITTGAHARPDSPVSRETGTAKEPWLCPLCHYPVISHRSTCARAPRTGLDLEMPPAESQRIRLEAIGTELLAVLGCDLTDPSLKETPRRWAKWWQEFISHADDNTATAFDAPGTDQMVVVRGVRVWSLCEHHLLPFWCDLTMAYIPAGKILGLSKFARIAQRYAHRLQVQERLTSQIADHIADVTGSLDVAVIGEGEHLCMTMRGARAPHRMTSSAIRGAFRTDQAARNELFHLAGTASR